MGLCVVNWELYGVFVMELDDEQEMSRIKTEIRNEKGETSRL